MIQEPPVKFKLEQSPGILGVAWATFFGSVYRICSALTQSGTTAQRPTTILWIGRMYYDTTLSQPIWVNEITPSIVWKDAAGNTV